MYNLNTPICHLTVGEFMEIYGKMESSRQIDSVKQNATEIPKSEKRFVYGLKGIAELFGCSVSTASKIKRSGVIDKAITQIGRKMTIDTELALELVRKSKVKHR